MAQPGNRRRRGKLPFTLETFWFIFSSINGLSTSDKCQPRSLKPGNGTIERNLSTLVQISYLVWIYFWCDMNQWQPGYVTSSILQICALCRLTYYLLRNEGLIQLQEPMRGWCGFFDKSSLNTQLEYKWREKYFSTTSLYILTGGFNSPGDISNEVLRVSIMYFNSKRT